jgi:hypothetical protein
MSGNVFNDGLGFGWMKRPGGRRTKPKIRVSGGAACRRRTVVEANQIRRDLPLKTFIWISLPFYLPDIYTSCATYRPPPKFPFFHALLMRPGGSV